MTMPAPLKTNDPSAAQAVIGSFVNASKEKLRRRTKPTLRYFLMATSAGMATSTPYSN